MSRQTSGIIINNDIFLNSDHVVSMKQIKESEDTYKLYIYMSGGIYADSSPIIYTFSSDIDCNNAFKKIIQEMYGYNYAIVDFKTNSIAE